MEEMKIPKNMGYGEGGETLPKLGKILQGIVGNINDLAARVEAVEALDGNLNSLTARVEALEDEVNDLIARIEALEGEGEGEGGGEG